MIQRSSVSTIATSAEVAETFRERLQHEQIATLRRAFALPSTLGGFLLFALGLAIICSGLAVQVLLSAQIRQVEVENAAIRADLERIGQQNTELMWQIARVSSLEAVRQRALEIGFQPVEEPVYVVHAADAPAYFGADAVGLTAEGRDDVQRGAGFGEEKLDADMVWTSGLVSVVRQRVASAVDQLVR